MDLKQDNTVGILYILTKHNAAFQKELSAICSQRSIGAFPHANAPNNPNVSPIGGPRTRTSGYGQSQRFQVRIKQDRPNYKEKPINRRFKHKSKNSEHIDVDGDVVMGASKMNRKSFKNSKKAPKGKKIVVNSRKKKAFETSLASIKGNLQYQVRVINPMHLSIAEVDSFLRSNCAEPFHVIHSRATKNCIFFTLPSANERAANTLKRMSGKVHLNGQPVEIKVFEKIRQDNLPAFKLPVEIFSPRYDPTTKFLSLSGIVDEPDLAPFKSPDGLNSMELSNAIIEVIQENCPDLVSLDLSNNGIYSLDGWRRLGHVAKSLENLSLEGNQLQSIFRLSGIRSCRNVKTLVLLNNPCAAAFQQDRLGYEKAVLKYFRNLKELDGSNVSMPVLAAGSKTSNASLLLGPSEHNVGPEDIIVGCRHFLANLMFLSSADFAIRYFQLYDTHRDKLIHAYQDEATFRLNIPNIGHGRASLRSYAPPKKKGRTVDTMKNGPVDIVALLKRFPQTQHEDADAFGICIRDTGESVVKFSVSGRFEDVSPNGDRHLRMFRREFQLSPVPESSASAAYGWPCIIASEMLTIAPYTDSIAVAHEAPSVQLQPDNQQPSVTTHLSMEQMQQMIQLLQEKTKMKLELCKECLENNGWNVDSALANFEQLKSLGEIPESAFL
eukprot:gene902-4165_t